MDESEKNKLSVLLTDFADKYYKAGPHYSCKGWDDCISDQSKVIEKYIKKINNLYNGH